MKLLSRLTAVVTGGITTAVLLSVSEISLLISILAGVATTGATLLAIPSSSQKNRPAQPKIPLKKKSLPAPNNGETDLKTLKNLVLQVPRGETRTVLDHVVSLADQLVHATEKDPRDEPQLRSFFNHYLPSTIKIIRSYLDLTHQGNKTEEIRATLEKTEHTLITIETAFKNQLTKLLDNDILDLDVEVSVLEQSLRLDGLVDKNSEEKGRA